jgi:alanine racemase
MTDGIGVPRSFSATGGLLLGRQYHFEVTRPGIGLYGGLPFEQARPVVRLALPVVQVRELAAGETVGYSNTWAAPARTRIATVSAGYADGLLRAMSGRATVHAGGIPCPVVGRVSMDLITVDITQLDGDPEEVEILGAAQGVDRLAEAAGTIGYEILTSLGPRYRRHYAGGAA